MPVHPFWRNSKAPDGLQRPVSPSRTGADAPIKPAADAVRPALPRKRAISQMPLQEAFAKWLTSCACMRLRGRGFWVYPKPDGEMSPRRPGLGPSEEKSPPNIGQLIFASIYSTTSHSKNLQLAK
jgi:hypothetical protein